MNQLGQLATDSKLNPIAATICLILAVLTGYVAQYGLSLSMFLFALPFIGFISFLLINNPKLLLITLVAYCFTFFILIREVGGGIPYGMLIEGLLLVGWAGVFFNASRYNFGTLRNELCALLLCWLLISLAQIANPSGANPMGWLLEIRSAAIYPLLIVSLAFIVLRDRMDLDRFLVLIISFSLLATFNGIKQLHFGLSPGEQLFLDQGGSITHVLWGKLRVFSFYSEAAQFGASQAHIGVVTLCLAFGPFKWWKRLLLFMAAFLSLYGMMISGTRGALFALIVGIFFAILLSKQYKMLLFGGSALFVVFLFLKFTHIGDGNYQIYRLRSALNPSDPSLNVRFATQAFLRDYMKDKPFGEGLGVIGAFGNEYNASMFISTVQPDSYFVKVWVMYGIVGFTVWLGIMAYILGKCCGVVWRITDPGLRIKLLALTAGYAGILVSSYGNEVINTMPTSIIVYVSWVLVLKAPQLQKSLSVSNQKSSVFTS